MNNFVIMSKRKLYFVVISAIILLFVLSFSTGFFKFGHGTKSVSGLEVSQLGTLGTSFELRMNPSNGELDVGENKIVNVSEIVKNVNVKTQNYSCKLVFIQGSCSKSEGLSAFQNPCQENFSLKENDSKKIPISFSSKESNRGCDFYYKFKLFKEGNLSSSNEFLVSFS